MRKAFALATVLPAIVLNCLAAGTAQTDEMEITVEIPRLNVSEYHRPYVAIWIQDEKRKAVSDLAVWYQLKNPQDEVGEKWLPDLRQWWRRSGRTLELPLDGVSGATRPAGKHTLTFSKQQSHLSKLRPGQYILVVEAAREVGGRELVEIPFSWPASQRQSYAAEGTEELGQVTLTVRP